jgi:predicted nucleic acid-binding protein
VTGTLLLDCEGLSRLLRRDPSMDPRMLAARKRDRHVAVSTVTIVEANHRRVDPRHLSWVLSRLKVLPVTEEIARHATVLLQSAGDLHGHRYAIDAIVAATALRTEGPVNVLTSDPEDMAMLCGPQVKIVKI